MEFIEKEVRNYIIENFLFGQDDQGLSNSDSFLEKGIIDSTGILILISFLEDKYQITVEDAEIVPANLDSVHNIASFINKKQGRNGTRK
ncbi:MAG TPA: acyl carrier protein [Nitrospiria bacterium]|nr:acyl carrier protein [Nitrospiria bacterium]